MTHLVLGASGFIGRWLARLLTDAGAPVVQAARAPEVLTGDVRRFDALESGALEALLGDVRPTVVFNAIGYGVDRSERDEALARRINAELPEAIARRLGPGQRLIHIGSALEYGTIGGDLFETSIPNPTTLYGRTKLEGTERLQSYAVQARLQAVTARLFTVYGPGEHDGRLLPSLFAAARSATPLDFTAGEQRRDFTYVEEAARALLALAASGRVSHGEVVNVATGRLVSVRAFIEAAIEVLGIPPERIRFGGRPSRPDEMCHDQVAIGRLRAWIGWAPAVTPEQGIRLSARRRHMSANPVTD